VLQGQEGDEQLYWVRGNKVELMIQGGSNMTGTNCDLFTHKSVPVIFEPPCTFK
jgi:hypothetical protein